MATIGHTLAGLTSATMGRRRSPNETARPLWPSLAWWPGVLILGAHLPDVVEWLLTILGVQTERTHQFHSVKACFGCVLAGSLLMLLVGRVRSPWPHVVWAGAVFSHLLLDWAALNHEIRIWYRDPPPDVAIQPRGLDIAAESWFYSFWLVMAIVLHALIRAASVTQRRIVAVAAVVAAACAFVPNPRFVWILGYAVALGVSLAVLRPRMRAAWLWNLVLIAPVASLGLIEAWAAIDVRRAQRLEDMGAFREAAALLERSVRLPTRTTKAIRLWDLGRCHQRSGDWNAAEQAYKACVEADVEWHWSELILADFYLTPGTPRYRPREGTLLLRKILAGDAPEFVRRAARQRLSAFEAAETMNRR